ncbi:TFIIH complex serine/threonine-protein kinase subunit kin28 [Tilletia horrida]|nr:TFIIH complex serine/threonine-protein kinase subunit kin28 [Tilletia horrida]
MASRSAEIPGLLRGEPYKKWLHLDLKPCNILVFDGHAVKITDFSLAHELNNTKLPQPIGTLGYRPPEELFNCHFAHSSMDIWPLGTIYMELRLGHRVFNSASNVLCFKSMLDLVGTKLRSVFEVQWVDSGIEGARTFSLRDPGWDKFADVLKSKEVDFLTDLMALEPLRRPSARQALRHSFWTQHPVPKLHALPKLFL